MIENVIETPDGHQIQVFIWPNADAKAWVHIFHGMAEHAKRYQSFAEQLVAAGYAVVAHNHRGHGDGSCTVLGSYGYNTDDGWSMILQDIDKVRQQVCSDDRPYYIFAHSMGSFIAQDYLANKETTINGLILSGSNYQSPWLAKLGSLAAKLEGFRVGAHNSSPLLQFLSFGSFNQAFKPNRTPFDWLSRDQKQVDRYIADPLCGFACSTRFWQGFLQALNRLFKEGTLSRIQQDLPIFIMGGDQDPVGRQGKGLEKLHAAYKALGQRNLSLKLYENGRHEMLNETNREEVTSDILDWLALQSEAN
jgi:alpha-beta hydrolase superfamily lysophospholipase